MHLTITLTLPESLLRNCSIGVLFQGLSKGGVRHRSNDSIHLLAILEDHDCGDAPDTVLSSYSRAFVCIELELQHCQVFVNVAQNGLSACLGVWKVSCKQYRGHKLGRHGMRSPCDKVCNTRCQIGKGSLTALILSPNATASSSTRGAIIRQGPHHGAQKSTNTGTGLFNTNSSKVESVTGPAAQTTLTEICMHAV